MYAASIRHPSEIISLCLPKMTKTEPQSCSNINVSIISPINSWFNPHCISEQIISYTVYDIQFRGLSANFCYRLPKYLDVFSELPISSTPVSINFATIKTFPILGKYFLVFYWSFIWWWKSQLLLNNFLKIWPIPFWTQNRHFARISL